MDLSSDYYTVLEIPQIARLKWYVSFAGSSRPYYNGFYNSEQEGAPSLNLPGHLETNFTFENRSLGLLSPHADVFAVI
jgi:hypothetical protein